MQCTLCVRCHCAQHNLASLLSRAFRCGPTAAGACTLPPPGAAACWSSQRPASGARQRIWGQRSVAARGAMEALAVDKVRAGQAQRQRGPSGPAGGGRPVGCW